MIDLHVHSSFSDGSYPPDRLAAMARQAGVSALALTDHDSTEGLDLFLKACREEGIMGIPGVEISVDVPHGTMHMLAYFIDHRDPDLRQVLKEIRDGRELRNHRILAKLESLGVKLTWDEVAAYAGEDIVGRPHFAQAMLAKGYVTNRDDAFDRYLGKGKPAYVDRFRLSEADSISAIRKAGGAAVLGHPFTLDLNDSIGQSTLEKRGVQFHSVE